MSRSVPYLLIALICCVALVAGCRPAPDPPDPPDDPEPSTETVTLFFADDEGIQSGDKGEFGFLRPVSREIEPGDDLIAAVMAELIRGPLAGDEGVDRTLPTSAEVREIRVVDGVATVDFTADFWRDYSGGTLGGSLFIGSMIYTLTDLDGVSRVLVLVEGEPWSDGHYYWDEPLARDN